MDFAVVSDFLNYGHLQMIESKFPTVPPSVGATLLGIILFTSGNVTLAQTNPADATDVMVSVASMKTVRAREGITGAGWAVAYDVGAGPLTFRKVVNIYPNHPDDWGKTAGTGMSYSLDRGETWKAGDDNFPVGGMVDMWQDRIRDGTLLNVGLHTLPDRQKLPKPGFDGMYQASYSYGVSLDQGTTWQFDTATVRTPEAIGPIARPLPHIIQEPDGTLLMPAYSWNQQGNVAVLLKSWDMGTTWEMASTIATATAIRSIGVPITTPWFEHMVERVADGSLLAVIRTASNSNGALIVARSIDNGATWSPPEKLFAGPRRNAVAGKLPNLCLLPNGILVLLTAHTRNHCRIYVSPDGSGRQWSDPFIITSQTGGNTSMVSVDYDKLLIFTPATGRIAGWEVTVNSGNSERLDLRAMHATGAAVITTDLLARSAANPATGITGPFDGSVNFSNAAMAEDSKATGSFVIALDRVYELNGIALALKAGEAESADVLLSADGIRWEPSGVLLENKVTHAALRTTFKPGSVARYVKINLEAPKGPAVLGEVALYPKKIGKRPSPPRNVVAVSNGTSTEITWTPPNEAAGVAAYLITPVLVKVPEADTEMQIYQYAPIKARRSVTRLDVSKSISRGARYRFEVAAMDNGGERSAVASSAEITVPSVSKTASLP